MLYHPKTSLPFSSERTGASSLSRGDWAPRGLSVCDRMFLARVLFIPFYVQRFCVRARRSHASAPGLPLGDLALASFALFSVVSCEPYRNMNVPFKAEHSISLFFSSP